MKKPIFLALAIVALASFAYAKETTKTGSGSTGGNQPTPPQSGRGMVVLVGYLSQGTYPLLRPRGAGYVPFASNQKSNSTRSNNTAQVKTVRPAPKRNASAKTDEEIINEAIAYGDCAALYEYVNRGKDKTDVKLVTSANNALKRYTALDAGTSKYRTTKMEAIIRRVAKELTEQVFKDPKTALPGVVNSLTSGVSDQFLKVKTLHDWICDNIAYDAEMYFLGRTTAQDYVSVLKKKKAVCSGYTNLMNEMCRIAGIESIGINGYSKDFGYSGKIGGNTDHAWNGVHIGSKWYLVDVTWDAGHLESL